MVPVSFITISERLKELQLPRFDLIIGIGTGGIVPAALVAFHLNTELKVMVLNYRDELNKPLYEDPKVITLPGDWKLPVKRILLVDDVSVTGKTLQKARELLSGYDVTTLTMKGNADFVLFPEIKDCVRWPWKP
jgi:uncharacterized protein